VVTSSVLQLKVLIIPLHLLNAVAQKEGEKIENISSLASGLFMELASEARLSILLSLKRKPAKLSTLAREHDTTVQEVYRNLNRLMQEGLAEKGVDGLFHLTELGLLVMDQLPYFIFLKNHRFFLEEHDLLKSGLPSKFLRRIGELEGCKEVNSVTAVLQKLKKLESSANQSIKAMIAQALPEETSLVIESIRHGVDVSIITGQNTIVPKDLVKNFSPTLEKLFSEKVFKHRMLDRVPLAVYIADNSQAAVMFPDRHGEVDMSKLFVSEDPKFCEWCSDLFEYYWQRSRPFSLEKTKVVE
jgi:predicted transcriptional regulator